MNDFHRDQSTISESAVLCDSFSHVSLKHGFFYRSTPKVASSSLLMTLQRLELGDPHFIHSPISLVHDRRLSPLAVPTQLPSLDPLLNGELFRFCFVRNPVDRFIATYLDKVFPVNGGLAGKIAATIGLKNDAIPTLDQFAQAVAAQDHFEMDPHYSVQSNHLALNSIEYDFIGRLENYDRDLAVICERLSIGVAQWESRVDHHSTGKKDYTGLLSTDLMRKISSIYEDDFAQFGYSDFLSDYC